MGLSFSRTQVPKDKKIVIIGAGYGGAFLGVELQKQNANFMIIDVKDSFYHNVGAVRAAIEPDFAEKLYIPYRTTFGENFKQGRVIHINTQTLRVILESGEEIEYDILVIATGSTGFTPYKSNIDHPNKDQMIQECSNFVNKVKDSKDFVVIGGGAVGCEIAGELCTELKDVKVTLIHSHDVLVHPSLANKKNFQNSVKHKLMSQGVNLVLGEKVVSGLEESGIYGPCDVVTDVGNTFTADTVFRCTGSRVNSQAYQKSFADVMNEDGTLQVNEHLQVKNYSHIFALGDCNDVKEMKLAYRTRLQLDVLKYNINVLFHNIPLQSYNPGSATYAAIISLGRNDSSGVMSWGYMVPSFLLTWVKSKDLMLAQFWKQMRQKPPSYP